MPIPYLKLAIVALSAIVGFGTGWTVHGWMRDSADLAQLEAGQKATEAAVAEAKKIVALRQANTEAAAQLEIERNKETRVVERLIVDEVIKYVQTPAASNCALDANGVRIINASARVPATPEATGTPDARPATINAARVVQSVTYNYGICIENANQLKALQDWIKANG